MTPEQLAELVAALDLGKNDFVVDAVLLVRVKDFDSGATGLSMSATVDVDWITQLGIIRAAELITTREIRKKEVED